MTEALSSWRLVNALVGKADGDDAVVAEGSGDAVAARDEFERIYYEYHLVRESHSMTRVSERTGLERTHLYRKLKQLGIESARKRGA